MLEKGATIIRFQYLPLGEELKAQTEISKKRYQKFEDSSEFDKKNHKRKTSS